ncbi:MAG TPA: hypothetical protein VK171_14215 [Fimbriimonas sp.]|nr:hypothetical protein [Fimbriimonas sp.]
MKVFVRVATWVLALVVVGFVILKSGRYSITSDLSLSSYTPSGTSAFLELTKRLGYLPTLDDTIAPNLDNVSVIPYPADDSEAVRDFLAEHIKPGSTTLLLGVETERVKDTASNVNYTVMEPGQNKKFSIFTPSPYGSGSDWLRGERTWASDADGSTLMQSDYGHKVRVYKLNGGTVIAVDSANFIQNHLIDKGQNAEMASALLAYATGGVKNVNVVNYFAGKNINNSIIARLGAPFESGWSQLWVAATLIFLANCVRFGKPPIRRAKQGSQHELALAIAQTLRTSRNPAWALREILDRTMLALERRHRVSRSILLDDASSPLSLEQVNTLNYTLEQLRNSTTERDLLHHAKNLQRLV